MFDMTCMSGMGFVSVFQGLNSMGIEFLINMTRLVGIDVIVAVQPLTLTLKWIQLCQHSLFSLDTHHAASPRPHGQPDRLAQTD
jgi:hypothetical protein